MYQKKITKMSNKSKKKLEDAVQTDFDDDFLVIYKQSIFTALEHLAAANTGVGTGLPKFFEKME